MMNGGVWWAKKDLIRVRVTNYWQLNDPCSFAPQVHRDAGDGSIHLAYVELVFQLN